MSDLDRQMAAAAECVATMKAEIGKVLVGQHAAIEQVLLAFIGRGHVLVEGVPGLGKTLLVRALSQCFAGRCARVQFTPDLMPSDVTGHAVFNRHTETFDIRRGPAFTNILLADEINRAPAKTQAALLEVMQEAQITIEGESYPTCDPFMVLATQNPADQEGTYPLPEAELDRFMLKVQMDYPEKAEEVSLLKALTRATGPGGFDLRQVQAVASTAQIQQLQHTLPRIHVDEQVLEYIVTLVRTTRTWPGLARGAGPRASMALLTASRALALLRHQTFVTPDLVRAICLPVLRHRIGLTAELQIEGLTSDQVLTAILDATNAPRQ